MGKCKTCGGAGRVEVKRDGEEVVLRCPDCASAVDITISPEICGAPLMLWPGRDPKNKIVSSYLSQLPGVAERGAGLYITGPVNSGKTSTLLWVADAAMRSGVSGVRYYRMRELFARIVNNWKEIQKAADGLCEFKVLLIDDAFDVDRGWFDAEVRKIALDELLRPFVEKGGALLMASCVDMDGAANVWGKGRAGLLDKRLVEVRLKKSYSAAIQREIGRGLK